MGRAEDGRSYGIGFFCKAENIESVILLMDKRVVTVNLDEGKAKNVIMWRLMFRQVRSVSSETALVYKKLGWMFLASTSIVLTRIFLL